MQWVKNHFWKVAGIVFLILVLVPLGVDVGIGIASHFGFGVGTDGEWVGFWGDYLGVIISVSVPIIFAIYYTDTQIEINRKAQVQAYLEQERLVALNKYQFELLTAHDSVRVATNKIAVDNFGECCNDIDQAILILQEKCNRYVLLTGKAKSVGINRVQNDIQKFHTENIVKLEAMVNVSSSSSGEINPVHVEKLRESGYKLAKILMEKERRVGEIFKDFYSD